MHLLVRRQLGFRYQAQFSRPGTERVLLGDWILHGQAGIDAACSSDHVWVAAGTYVCCITLKDDVALDGGFPEAGGNWESRNMSSNVTPLDGNQRGSVVTAAPGGGAHEILPGLSCGDMTGVVIPVY